jgi:hypothetical protein
VAGGESTLPSGVEALTPLALVSRMMEKKDPVNLALG